MSEIPQCDKKKWFFFKCGKNMIPLIEDKKSIFKYVDIDFYCPRCDSEKFKENLKELAKQKKEDVSI